MLVEQPEIRRRIFRAIQGAGCPGYLREEYEQEATIHLWLSEVRCPGQTLSWYCRACCFHVRHEAARGRSIDSPKRSHRGCALPGPEDEAEMVQEEFAATGGTPFENCAAQDLFEQLALRLDPLARRILCYLAQGFTVCEVAALVGVSHPTVIKQRSRIDEVAGELGIAVRRKARQGSMTDEAV